MTLKNALTGGPYKWYLKSYFKVESLKGCLMYYIRYEMPSDALQLWMTPGLPNQPVKLHFVSVAESAVLGWKILYLKVKVLVAQSCRTLWSPTRPLCSWNSLGKNTGLGHLCVLQEIFPDAGIKPRFATLQGDSLLSEPPGEPKSLANLA